MIFSDSPTKFPIPPRFYKIYCGCPIVLQWFYYSKEGPYVMYGGLYIFGIRVAIWRRE